MVIASIFALNGTQAFKVIWRYLTNIFLQVKSSFNKNMLQKFLNRHYRKNSEIIDYIVHP